MAKRIHRGYITTIAVRAGGEDFELTDETETKAFMPNPLKPQFQTPAEAAKHAAIMEADYELAHSRERVRGIARYKWIARRAGVLVSDVQFHLGLLKNQ